MAAPDAGGTEQHRCGSYPSEASASPRLSGVQPFAIAAQDGRRVRTTVRVEAIA